MQNKRMRQSLKHTTRLIAVFMAGIMIFPSGGVQKSFAKSEESQVVTASLKGRGFMEATDLGPMAGTPNVPAAAFNVYDGRLYAYAATVGDLFSVVDVESNQRVDLEEMPDVGTAYTHTVAPDGKVYVAGDKGILYVYDPATKNSQKIGTVLAGHQVWSAAGDEEGNIYFGTYKAGGAHVVKYNEKSRTLEDLGEADPIDKSDYVRSMAYKDGKIYLGLGLSAKVHVMDVNDQNRIKDITPDNFHERIKKDPADGVVQYVYSMGIAGNTLFAHVDSGKKDALLFYHLNTQKWDDKVIHMDGVQDEEGFDFGTWNFTHLPVHGDYAYLIHDRHLMQINHKTLDIVEKITKYPSGLRGGTVLVKDGNPIVLTISRGGEIVYMNVADKTTTRASESVMGAPLGLHNLAAGNNGKLYMTTYPGGPKGAEYDPKTGEVRMYNQGQAEGIIAGEGDEVYFGIYPGAVIQSMDTNDTGKFTTLFEMKTEYEQDRPYIMQYQDGLLLIGTIPDYGKTGGALSIYNPSDGTHKVYKNVVDKQSIVGLAMKDGIIYGSTSKRGGLGIPDNSPILPADSPKIFVWDVEKEIKIAEFTLDIPGLNTPMISGLTFDKEGNLWGAADGILFTIDTNTNQVSNYKNIYPEISGRGMWRPVHIKFGADGLLYTDLAGKLTVVDHTSENWDYVTLPAGGKEVDFIELAYDNEGRQNVYFLDNGATTLKMIPVIDGGWVQQPPKIVENPVEVTNSGFEEFASSLSGWSGDAVTLSDIQKYDGKYSMLVEGGKATSGNITSVQSGGDFEASAYVYSVSGSAILTVEFLDIAGTFLGEQGSNTNGTGTWEKVVISGAAPEGTAMARIVVESSEAAYFDTFNMTSTPVGVPNDELLLNGNFSNGLNHWTKRDQLNPLLADVVVDKAPGSNGEMGTGSDSAKFTDKTSGAGVFVISDRMNVNAGISYDFKFDLFMNSGMVSGTDLSGNPIDSQPNRCSVYVRYYDQNNIRLTPELGKSYTTGQGAWQYLTEVSTAPSGAVTAEIWIGLSNFYMAESVYFANLSFKAVAGDANMPISLTIPNPSLEDNSNIIPGWTPWGGPWTACSYQIDGNEKFTGEYSLKIVDNSTDENIFLVSDSISLVPDAKSHKASVRMLLPNGRATLMMRYYDTDGKQVGQDMDGVNIIHVQTASNDWREIEAIVPVPEGAVNAKIWLGMSKFFTSTGVYYDDIKLVGLMEQYALTVEGGSGSGDYKAKENVQIAANKAPSGMKFDRWVLISGDGQIEDVTSENTTFIMGSKSTLIKAIFTAVPTPVEPPVDPPVNPPVNPPVTKPEEPKEESKEHYFDQISVTEKVELYVGGTKDKTGKLSLIYPSNFIQVERFGTITDRSKEEMIIETVITEQLKGKKATIVNGLSGEVISLDKEGTITAKKEGTATIQTVITLKDGSRKIYHTIVTVETPSITFTKKFSHINVGDKMDFAIEVKGYDTTTLEWRTEEVAVATVGRNTGKLEARVTAKTEGKDILYVRVKDDNGKWIRKEISIQVEKPSITFIKRSSSIKVGDKVNFTVEVKGYDISTLEWRTKEIAVATVGRNTGNLKAKVTAKTKGKDTLYVRVKDNNGTWIYKNFSITVSNAK